MPAVGWLSTSICTGNLLGMLPVQSCVCVHACVQRRLAVRGSENDCCFYKLICAVELPCPALPPAVLHFVLSSCREEATANLVLDSGVDLSIAINEPVRWWA